MLKILKKCVFVDFICFFVKMQSPDCPPNGLVPFGVMLVWHNISMNYEVGIKKYSASGNDFGDEYIQVIEH